MRDKDLSLIFGCISIFTTIAIGGCHRVPATPPPADRPQTAADESSQTPPPWNGKLLILRGDRVQNIDADYRDSNQNGIADAEDAGWFAPGSTVKVAIALAAIEVNGGREGLEPQLKAALGVSDNRATNQLIERVGGIEALNQILAEKGFQHSIVGDRCGLTDLGKIPVGALCLGKFNAVQEPLLLSEWEAYRGRAERADMANLSAADECRADLRIYEAQLRRILSNRLYFLEVRADGHLFHKIGITRREIGDRICEVERDLLRHYSDVAVNLLGLWEHRGNVELYFKHRYSEFNCKIGRLTEYFQFPDVKAVLNDLHGMGPKVLSDAEERILRGS